MKTCRSLFIFFLALSLLTTLGLWAPTSARATSECLGEPTEAVQDWKELYPCCFDSETCEDLCWDWVKSCNDYAQFAFVCQFSSIKEVLSLEKQVECRTQEDKDSRKSCEQSLRDDQRDITDFLRDDLNDAKETCRDCYSDCFNFCIDD